MHSTGLDDHAQLDAYGHRHQPDEGIFKMGGKLFVARLGEHDRHGRRRIDDKAAAPGSVKTASQRRYSRRFAPASGHRPPDRRCRDDGLDIGAVVERWDASSDLAGSGVGYLLHGLLDYIVDGHFEAVQSMDDAVEMLEDQLFADVPQDLDVQRRSFELRKSLVLLRRIVIPMREVVNTLMRRDLHVVGDDLMPYYQDIYDHVLRAAEWTESLRDLVNSILETNLTIQGNRLNVITKKVTSWAAIIAVPTFITGFYGMNVPYPGFSRQAGFAASIVIMVIAGLVLYIIFKRKDWL